MSRSISAVAGPGQQNSASCSRHWRLPQAPSAHCGLHFPAGGAPLAPLPHCSLKQPPMHAPWRPPPSQWAAHTYTLAQALALAPLCEGRGRGCMWDSLFCLNVLPWAASLWLLPSHLPSFWFPDFVGSVEVSGECVAVSKSWIQILTLPLASGGMGHPMPLDFHPHIHKMGAMHTPAQCWLEQEERREGWATPWGLLVLKLHPFLLQGKLREGQYSPFSGSWTLP